MPKRERYLAIVDNQASNDIIFAPLTDSLFGASFAGKPWISDCTVADQTAATQACGYHGSLVRGSTPDLTVNPVLTGLVETERTTDTEEERRYRQRIATPKGELSRDLVEQPKRGITATSEWMEDEDELPAALWIVEEVLAGRRDQAILDLYGPWVEEARAADMVTQVQLELPFFFFSLPGFADGPVMLAMDEDSEYHEAMAGAEKAIHHVASLLVRSGVDFIWLGAGGTEILSPTIWEELVIPQSKRLVEHVRAQGGRTHFHCCGQSRLWIEKGYFNEIGMDVVETLSAPPSGSVEDVADARSRIAESVVTRGNIDLGLILQGTPEACADAAREVIAATKGKPHLVGAGDAILYGTPPANLQAIAKVCEAANA